MGLRKRGVIYIPFIMVLILIFGLVIGSNYTTRDLDVYLNYENITDFDQIDIVNDFIEQFERIKRDYYYEVDMELRDGSMSFLDYIKSAGIKVPNGKVYMMDFSLDGRLNPNDDKVLYYYSNDNKEGYYFYAIENGRNIDLTLARVFRI